ncbi:transcription initiation factor TFIID 23-30kDa subunit-domain-containing protein [Sphaerosporella brunnea]|uniref:Transcription initiation factor TFIID subunit 10 n=1 Tax=Sphaerosporella brunnea TaxID=1250544 RepID=A0A5J5EZ84_9PEZI|nr:transcription initiation factor TFIID 23-30kDa subunit-domain-containing protein [Sphaerosporella brunnea]
MNGIQHAPLAPPPAAGNGIDGSNDAPGASAAANSHTAVIAPAPPPTRKDRNLREFLDMMEEYAPIIPDAVTDYYLSLAGMQTNDIRLKRLLALATQKFIADIAADAYQYSRIRQNSSNAGGAPSIGVPGAGAAGAVGAGSGTLRPTARPGFGGGGGSGGTAGRTVLTMEDLGSAVGEYGVNTRRPEFYR